MFPQKLKIHLTQFSEEDQLLIEQAYFLARDKHTGQKRRSGSPYIFHPLRVAINLAKDGYDVETIISGLLHDTLEDTDTTPENIKTIFGETILRIVEGVTKVSTLKIADKAKIFSNQQMFLEQVDNYRKILFAATTDPRVMIVKLYDRLDNVETIQWLPAHKRKFYARETIEIFAPIAERLGMGMMKGLLEDTAFPYAYPAEYDAFNKKIRGIYKNPHQVISRIIPEVSEKVAAAGIKVHSVSGRAKFKYSLYKKLLRKGNVSTIYDIIALRLIVGSVEECYQALGIVHSLYEPIPNQIDDYIAKPKSNGYQSLQTTVRDPFGHIFEIQIRTLAMHEAAEYGPAAHWQYKDSGKDQKNAMEWVNELEKLKNIHSKRAFLTELKEQLFSEQVFVFTPRGDIIRLPLGSTPVDLAYRVHTEVGHHCVGSKINGRLMPLSTQLRNGDRVEILSSKVSWPSEDWLTFVRTSQARQKIKLITKKKHETILADIGLHKVSELIERLGLPPLDKEAAERKLSRSRLPYKSLDRALAAIGDNTFKPLKLLKSLHPNLRISAPKVTKTRPTEGHLVIPELRYIRHEIANCCHPKTGDEIIAYLGREHILKIHKTSCKHLKSVDTRRIISIN